MTVNEPLAGPSPSPTLHEAFLERAASVDPGMGGGGHALGAFLTMRLVDQFAAETGPAFPDALAYQITSTRDYLANLHPQTVELGHLQEIARAAGAAHERDTNRVLWPPMLAFAYWLEQEHQLSEALDVIETALRLSDGRDAEEEVAALLQRARLVRKLSRYDEATASYRAGQAMAARLGDGHSERLGRIGQGITLQKVGNLPQAVRVLEGVIEDALEATDEDAEARARHDLANAYMLMGRPSVAVPEAFRAFQLYGTEAQRIRALGDIGMAFKMLAEFQPAEDAFQIVLGSSACTAEIRINTMLELLHVAASTRDRVSFERWRKELEANDVMRPDAMVDLRMKLGLGWAAFGHPERGRALLREAVSLAEQHGLNAFLFSAEQALEELAEATNAVVDHRTVAVEGETEGVETLRVAGELHALRAAVS